MTATLPPVAPEAPPPGPEPVTPARLGRHPLMRFLALSSGALLTAMVIGFTAFAGASVLVRTSEQRTDTFTGPIARVVVRVSGSATIRPGPEGRARVQRDSDFGLTRPTVSQELVDGVLTVRVRCRGMVIICDNHVDLDVPPGAALDVGANHVRISDMTGPITLDNDGGAVELERVSGRIDARVGGGAVIGRELASDEVRVSAGAGAIELTFQRAPTIVDANAGAGHIEVVVPRGGPAYRVDARSGAGGTDVQIANDPEGARTIRAHAGAGGVVVRYAA